MSIDIASIEHMTAEELTALQQQIAQRHAAQVLTLPDQTATGRGKPTLANTRALFDFYNISIRYNEMRKDMDIDIPHHQFSRDTEGTAKMQYLKSLARKHELDPADIFDHVGLIGNENSYHPVRDWIDQQIWDGHDRLPAFYNSIELEVANPLKETMMRKWALSAVAALYHDNFSSEGVLTLTAEQGKGKTVWVERLLPYEARNVWNKDAVVINMNNKDSLLKALSFWIVELGEIDATFKKSDIESLKAFITEKFDILRSPYGIKANNYSRRTVFYGTVNDMEFLQDQQNRRFWVLRVREFHDTQLDPAQFWAQLKQLYLKIRPQIVDSETRLRHNEYGWFLSPQERAQLQKTQNIFKTSDPITETLDHHVIVPVIQGQNSGEWLNPTMILKECGIRSPTKRDLNTAGNWLRDHGYRADGQRRYNVEIRRDTVFNMSKMGAFD
jgi:putative DNA primase/helicase